MDGRWTEQHRQLLVLDRVLGALACGICQQHSDQVFTLDSPHRNHDCELANHIATSGDATRLTMAVGLLLAAASKAAQVQ